MDGEKKLVDKVEHSEIIDTIFHAWEKLVESPTQELYASNLMELQDACKNYPVSSLCSNYHFGPFKGQNSEDMDRPCVT